MPKETRKRPATASRVPSPASYAARIRSRKSKEIVFTASVCHRRKWMATPLFNTL